MKITDLSRGGAGVARDDTGRVIFVPFSAPGDLVRVRILDESPRYAQAELLEIVEASPVRQEAPCPVFGRCGGCQWQHIPYSLQWETKKGGVFHALARVKIGVPGEPDLRPADRIWNYRNRVQLRGFQSELGFYAARSHDRVSIEGCPIAREEINRVLPAIREEGRALEQPYKVEVEVLPTREVRKTWNARHAAGGFRQVNDEQNEKLRGWVTQNVGKKLRVLDLFGGSGNLGAPVSVFSEVVDCVDVGAPEGTQLPEFPNLRFHRSPVLKFLKRLQREGKTQYDCAIVDPPREGLGDELVETAPILEGLGVRELVAIGCDPDSWARDLSRWVKRGWQVDRMGVLDLFPQTPHVESLARLTRPL